MRSVPFFNGSQRMIFRHRLNSRHQRQVLAEYVKSVTSRGIVRGVRGDAWLVCPEEGSSDVCYKALTFGTLLLGWPRGIILIKSAPTLATLVLFVARQNLPFDYEEFVAVAKA